MSDLSTGYYYTYIFNNANCAFLEDSPYQVIAFATDVCLKSSAATSNILTYISHGSPSVLKISYMSPNCDPTKGSTNSTIPLVCQGGYGNASYYHGYSSNIDIQSIIPNDGNSYAVATYFGDSKCSRTLSFNAFINDDCITDSQTTSIYADYPTRNAYSKTTNCTGPSATTKYVSSCTATGTTTSSFTYVNSIFIDQGSASSNSNGLGWSTPVFAGVIIGSVVGGIVLVAIAYYTAVSFFIKPQPLSTMQEHGTPTSFDRTSSTSSVQRSFKFY